MCIICPTPGQVILLGHSRRVAEHGYYLDIADILMYACSANVNVRLIVNSPSLRVMSIAELLEHLSPQRDWPSNLFPAECKKTWSVILTTASLRPTDDLKEMNHWLPAWHEEDLQHMHTMSHSSTLTLDARLEQSKADHERMFSGNRSMSASEWDEFVRQRTASLNFTALLTKLLQPELRFTAAPVAPDGNCGAYTLLALLTANPWQATTSDHHTRDQMMGIRRDLVSQWVTMSDWKTWQHLFRDLCPDEVSSIEKEWRKANTPTDVKHETDAISKTAKQEECPSTPPKKIDRSASVHASSPIDPKMPAPPKVSRHARLSSQAGLVAPRTEETMRRKFGGAVVPDAVSKVEKTEKTRGKDGKDTPVKIVKKTLQKEPKEKRVRRRCENKIREKETKMYLADRGLTYSAWLHEHYFRSSSSKALECQAGGYQKFQDAMKSGKQVACTTCSFLVCRHKICSAELQDHLEQQTAKQLAGSADDARVVAGGGCAASGCVVDAVCIDDDDDDNDDSSPKSNREAENAEKDVASTVMSVPDRKLPCQSKTETKDEQCEDCEERKTEAVVPHDSDPDEDPIAGGQKSKKDKKGKISSPSGGEDKLDVLKIVGGMKDVLRILPSGTHKKAHPVECLACTEFRNRPCIFDLVKLHSRQYLDQHIITSARHRDAMRFREQTAKNMREMNDVLVSLGDAQIDQKGDGSGDDGDEGPKCGELTLKAVQKIEKCSGFQFATFPHCRIALLKHEFEMYASYTNLSCAHFLAKTAKEDDPNAEIDERQHRYLHDLVKGTHTIFHRKCEGNVAVDSWPDPEIPAVKLGQHLVCRACRSFCADKTLVRNTARFTIKFYAARLLRARLFLVEPVEEVLEFIEGCALARHCTSAKRELQMIVKLPVTSLQNWVRSSFCSVPLCRASSQHQFLMASYVHPSLQVSPSGLAPDLAGKAELLARHMCQGKLNDVEDTDIKLGCMVASGILQSHPLIHGILVSVCEAIKREERGVMSMKGLKLSDTERRLVAESGVALSITSCNKALLKEFSMVYACKASRAMSNLNNLSAKSIPDPFLSICSVEVLKQNGFLSERVFPKLEKSCYRRLTMGFDKTYLLKQLNIISNRLGKGLVGLAFRPDGKDLQQIGNSFVLLPMCEGVEGQDDQDDQARGSSGMSIMPCSSPALDALDFSALDHALEMLDCIVWDPASRSKGNPRLSMSSIPMAYECKAETMLLLIGSIMQHAGAAVRSLVCDNHSTHCLIKRSLLGQYAAPGSVPFFGQIQYAALPGLEIMNFGYQIPLFEGEPIYLLCGPCHIQKILGYLGCCLILSELFDHFAI